MQVVGRTVCTRWPPPTRPAPAAYRKPSCAPSPPCPADVLVAADTSAGCSSTRKPAAPPRTSREHAEGKTMTASAGASSRRCLARAHLGQTVRVLRAAARSPARSILHPDTSCAHADSAPRRRSQRGPGPRPAWDDRVAGRQAGQTVGSQLARGLRGGLSPHRFRWWGSRSPCLPSTGGNHGGQEEPQRVSSGARVSVGSGALRRCRGQTPVSRLCGGRVGGDAAPARPRSCTRLLLPRD